MTSLSSSSTPSRLDARILDRYLAGDALSSGEIAQLDAVLERSAAFRESVSAIQQMAGSNGEAPDIQRGRALLRERVQERSRQRRNQATRPRFDRRIIGFGIGAALVVMGMAVASEKWEWMSSSPAAAETVVHLTGPGERAALQLPDGSAVVLGPSSRLAYTAGFTGSQRAVTLLGQALFTVIHHGDTPLVVNTARGRATVLGTSFSVRHYESDPTMDVIVAQGRVSLNNIVLGNGDRGRTRDGVAIYVEHNVSIADALAWTDGTLVLDRVSLQEAAEELERWYDMKIIVRDDALWRDSIVTTLTTEGPRQAMRFVAAAIGAGVQFKADTAILSRQ